MTTLGLRDLAFLGRLGGGVTTDPYFANVSLLLHGDGTNGSTNIVDSSPSPKTVQPFGNAQISTAIADPFGNSTRGVLAFDGNEDYLQTNNQVADFNLSTQDWTIELWHRSTSYSSSNNVLLNVRSSGSDKIVIATISASGWLFYLLNGSVVISSSSAVSAGSWSHVALVKSGSTTTLYRDGLSIGTTSSVPVSSNKSVQIGTDGGGAFFNGYIDGVRITKGVARYTANFTPPTAPFPDA